MPVLRYEDFIRMNEGTRPRLPRTVVRISAAEIDIEEAELIKEYDCWKIFYTNNKAGHDIISYITDPGRAGLSGVKEFNLVLKKMLKSFEFRTPQGYTGPVLEEDMAYVIVFGGACNFKMPLGFLSIESKRISIRTLLHRTHGNRMDDILLYTESVETIDNHTVTMDKSLKYKIIEVIVTK